MLLAVFFASFSNGAEGVPVQNKQNKTLNINIFKQKTN